SEEISRVGHRELPEISGSHHDICEICYPKTPLNSFLINGLWNDQGRRLQFLRGHLHVEPAQRIEFAQTSFADEPGTV
ncbi:MAG: hypothetical protein NTW15_04075, partial [Burkholderiales bacterium]|nr:hypothetical protein [Burkholderiales bacterium]